ncbi:DUF4430 domain-containing protein [Aneurinibacillus migulanus]|uniref:Transcobalamin-like C-terminal domain-containing protein n=2 Tax=Aneurinibacillus migulanus TaxID=47500 RepID=A0A1G8IW96_ANEMI|nr:DUF4430 domain-containing protein [Aneurinibacillus migulanus]MED0892293.1 DUF4430 domain-containing protein [Aneurinibacillus migulanus]MED1615755.1 DUF4430 domain-containing protein [Aneurinibacillus migulanus]GED12402.1 hypothetical protein AMI01nite_03930 [Aneurinibacillus migulanus]SDI23201.1 protein of unknown function [Aneurinibacillus migulanus]
MLKQVKRWWLRFFAFTMVIVLASGCVQASEKTNEPTQVTSINQQTTEPVRQTASKEGHRAESETAAVSHPTSEQLAQSKTTVKEPIVQKKAEQSAVAAEKKAPVQASVTAVPEQKQQARSTENKAIAPTAAPQVESKKPKETKAESKKQKTVLFSIVADKERGTVLPPTVVEIKDGETVLDALKRITREKKIQMEYRGVKATAYIEGIDNLYEFDRGAKSGWMYRVNGIFPNKSAGIFPVKDGDKVEWLYTVDLGKDVGAELK